MKKQVLLIVLMLMPLMASAHTEINGIYYNLTDKVAEVTSVPSGTSKYRGIIVIPETVVYGEMTYSVTSIGYQAFYECSNITSITIPNSVTSIGERAFWNCWGLTSVNISDIAAWCNIKFSVTNNYSINEGSSWFEPYSNPLYYAKHLYINGEEVKDLFIPDSVTSIKGYAFYNCIGLTSVTIPNKLTSIGDGAFSGCSGLTSADIPNSVTYIGEYAFSGCSGLTSMVIPDNMTTIENYVFYNCSGLISVTIPNKVTSIGYYAFRGCNNLTDLFCYANNIPTTDSKAFYRTNLDNVTLHVPSASINNYESTNPWSSFFKIVSILQCTTPIITFLAHGKVKVESTTEGAICKTTITASNSEPLTDGEISINTPLVVYTVTSYATKEGYNDSEVATATFRYEKAEGDMNGDGMLNITDVIHLVNMILGQ